MLKIVRWDGQEVQPVVGMLNRRPKDKVSQPHEKLGGSPPGRGDSTFYYYESASLSFKVWLDFSVSNVDDSVFFLLVLTLYTYLSRQSYNPCN